MPKVFLTTLIHALYSKYHRVTICCFFLFFFYGGRSLNLEHLHPWAERQALEMCFEGWIPDLGQTNQLIQLLVN